MLSTPSFWRFGIDCRDSRVLRPELLIGLLLSYKTVKYFDRNPFNNYTPVLVIYADLNTKFLMKLKFPYMSRHTP